MQVTSNVYRTTDDGITSKPATSFRFSSSQTLALFLLLFPHLCPFFYFIFCETSCSNYPLSFSIKVLWIPSHPFFSGNGTADVLAKQGACPAIYSPMQSLFFYFSKPLFTVLGMEAHCLIKVLQHKGFSVSVEEPMLPHRSHCVVPCRCNDSSILLLNSCRSGIESFLMQHR